MPLVNCSCFVQPELKIHKLCASGGGRIEDGGRRLHAGGRQAPRVQARSVRSRARHCSWFLSIRRVTHSSFVLLPSCWTDARQAQGFISFYKKLPLVRSLDFTVWTLVLGDYFGPFLLADLFPFPLSFWSVRMAGPFVSSIAG